MRVCFLLLLAAPFVCAQDVREDVAPGIRYWERQWRNAAGDPFAMQVLEADPKHPAVNLLPVRAGDRAISREGTLSMARRYGATAAINAGYFVMTGPYAGASSGAFSFNGEVISGGTSRTALLFCAEENYREHLEFDVVDFRGELKAADGAAIPIRGMNRALGKDDMVLYTPRLGASTLTAPGTLEITLDAASRVVAMEAGKGNAAIPRDGRVLAASGSAAEWVRAHVSQGGKLAVAVELVSRRNPCKAQDISGGGPLLVRDGKVNVSDEKFSHATQRHPRTAVAVTREGKMLFVTVDGRQERSVGMTFVELAEALISLGAVEAMNMDGGGSSAIVVHDRIRNSPSDKVERKVSDAVLLFSVSTAAELSTLVDKLAVDAAHISASAAAELKAKIGAADWKGVIAYTNQREGQGLSVAAARLVREAAAGMR